MQFHETLRCGIGRNCLWQKCAFDLHGEQWPDFIDSIAAYGHGAVHHQAGLFQDLVVGILVKRSMCHEPDCDKTHTQYRDQDKVEFGGKSHDSSRVLSG